MKMRLAPMSKSWYTKHQSHGDKKASKTCRTCELLILTEIIVNIVNTKKCVPSMHYFHIETIR